MKWTHWLLIRILHINFYAIPCNRSCDLTITKVVGKKAYQHNVISIIPIKFHFFFSFLRLTVDNFWSNEKRLPSSTKERLIALLNNLYSPATEESFLQYATFLLLERTSNSPDYKRKIFEHPLTQCNFQVLIMFVFYLIFLTPKMIIMF